MVGSESEWGCGGGPGGVIEGVRYGALSAGRPTSRADVEVEQCSSGRARRPAARKLAQLLGLFRLSAVPLFLSRLDHLLFLPPPLPPLLSLSPPSLQLPHHPPLNLSLLLSRLLAISSAACATRYITAYSAHSGPPTVSALPCFAAPSCLFPNHELPSVRYALLLGHQRSAARLLLCPPR